MWLSHVLCALIPGQLRKQPGGSALTQLQTAVYQMSAVYTSKPDLKKNPVGSGKAEDALGKSARLPIPVATVCVPGSSGRSTLTVTIFLAWVGNQPAVVWARGHQVWDAIVVVVIVTFVTDSVLIRVQLGAIDDGGAVVCAVLVAVPITAEESYSSGETLPGRSLGGLSAGWALSDPIRPFFNKAAPETTPPHLPSPERSQPLPV